MRDQLAFQSTLLDSIPQPVVVRDLEGKLLSCNRSYLSFNKRPGPALVGRRLDEVPDLTIDDASVRLIMALYRQSLEEDRPIF
ncbi:PAS domain-containing protein, partial [Staphylococcus aureus]|nr:PAS domain-containing protein [Staphylococcus aureus]